MNNFFKKKSAKSKSEPNLDTSQQNTTSLQNKIKEKTCNTYSAQYSSPTIPNLKKQTPKKINYSVDYQCPCFHNPPPCPQFTPPQNDLWDLQFCRWWGWNWVKKGDQQLCNKQPAPCTENKREEECRRCNKKRKRKQDDFFSWCHKLFKGGRRECSLPRQERQYLQDMYDTPSVADSCFQSRRPCSCKLSSYQNQCECCCQNKQKGSTSTIIFHDKRRQAIGKRNTKKCWLLNESSSSDECYYTTCPYLKKKPAISSDESVEYLSLQMKCVQSDYDNSRSKRCHRHCLSKTAKCTPINNIAVCNKCKYKEKPSYCSDHCKYTKDNMCLVPRFVRKPCCQNNICSMKHKPVCNQRTKEYVIRFPFSLCKKQKCNCARNENLKVMLDKSSSYQNMQSKYKGNYNDILNLSDELQEKGLPQDFQNSISSKLAGGTYSSPISGTVYNLHPKLFSPPIIPRRTNFPSPKNITEKITEYSNTENFPLVDREHKLILSAICEALASSHPSDDESNNSHENLAQFLSHNSEQLFFEDDTNTHPLKSNYTFAFDSTKRKLTSNTTSRIPLAKKRLIKSHLPSEESASNVNYENQYTITACNYNIEANRTNKPSEMWNGDRNVNQFETSEIPKPKDYQNLRTLLEIDDNIELTYNVNNAAPSTLNYLELFDQNFYSYENSVHTDSLSSPLLEQSHTYPKNTEQVYKSESKTVQNSEHKSLKNDSNECSFTYKNLFRELQLRQTFDETVDNATSSNSKCNDSLPSALDTNSRILNYSNGLEPIIEETCASLVDVHSSYENFPPNSL